MSTSNTSSLLTLSQPHPQTHLLVSDSFSHLAQVGTGCDDEHVVWDTCSPCQGARFWSQTICFWPASCECMLWLAAGETGGVPGPSTAADTWGMRDFLPVALSFSEKKKKRKQIKLQNKPSSLFLPEWKKMNTLWGFWDSGGDKDSDCFSWMLFSYRTFCSWAMGTGTSA